MVQKVIDADPVAAAVQKLMGERTEWQGTATELLTELAIEAGDRVSKSRSWPASARGLSSRIRRSAPFLRAQGLRIIADQGRSANARSISIEKTGSPPKVRDSASFASSPSSLREVNTLANDATDDANSDRQFASSFASQSKPLVAQGNDDDDANDAKSLREQEGSLPPTSKGAAGGIAGENVDDIDGQAVPSGLGANSSPKTKEEPVSPIPLYQSEKERDVPDSDGDIADFKASSPLREGLI